MRNFLVGQALKHIWCAPTQDRAVTLDLARVTRVGGARETFLFQLQIYKLPTSGVDYHVYTIGQNLPLELNLPEHVGSWVSLKQVQMDHNQFIDVYFVNGKRLNTSNVYIARLQNDTYIVAVQLQPKTGNLNLNKLYMRLYSNAYYDSVRDTDGDNILVTGGKLTDDVAVYLGYQTQYVQWRQRNYGQALAFLNGYLVNNPIPTQVHAGDFYEAVFDGSIKAVHEFKVSTLPTFNSTLDSTLKFLLHPPKGDSVIDYHDDISVFVVNKADPIHRGIMIHRNTPSYLRMVTHRDYSVPTMLIHQIVSEQQWGDLDDIYIRLYVRHSGYARPLIYEANRIHELYKLSDTQIVAAMVGLDATLAVWQADSLEQSMYTRVMRNLLGTITPEESLYAFGYNSVSKQIADSPLLPEPDGRFILPVGVQDDSTIFEYDAEGKLLGVYHYSGVTYYPTNPGCVLIEAVTGLGELNTRIAYGNAPVPLDPFYEYRVYMCPIIAGVPNKQWVDITGDFTKYEIVNNELRWLIDPAGLYGAVKSNRTFTYYRFQLPYKLRVFKFSIDDGQIGTPLTIPPGRLDIWLNGHALIENIDYICHFPEVTIISTKHIVVGCQTIDVRATGFCNSSLEREISQERGFVRDGFISLNHRFDVRDDKVMRVVVGGLTYHRNEIPFSESRGGLVISVPEGTPYSVESDIVPIHNVIPFQNYPIRDSARLVDKAVSDYLTLKLPETQLPNPVPIPQKYVIYSPLLAKLINDFVRRYRVCPGANITERQLAGWLTPYLPLLRFDPAHLGYDDQHLYIKPHCQPNMVTVTQECFAFLEWVNRLYLFNRVQLNHFVRIGADYDDGLPNVPLCVDEVPEIIGIIPSDVDDIEVATFNFINEPEVVEFTLTSEVVLIPPKEFTIDQTAETALPTVTAIRTISEFETSYLVSAIYPVGVTLDMGNLDFEPEFSLSTKRYVPITPEDTIGLPTPTTVTAVTRVHPKTAYEELYDANMVIDFGMTFTTPRKNVASNDTIGSTSPMTLLSVETTTLFTPVYTTTTDTSGGVTSMTAVEIITRTP